MALTELATRRTDVLARLQQNLPGRNLYHLAESFGITVYRDGKLNKGWVGQTIELAGGLSIDSRQHHDGEDFELKSTTLLPTADGGWKPKETVKVTMFSPESILEEEFERSNLWGKLSRLILVGCHHPDANDCRVVRVATFDMTDPELIAGVREYWEEMRDVLAAGEMGIYDSQGSSRGFLQLRPTGTKKTSSRCPITGELFQAKAFYATKRLVSKMLHL